MTQALITVREARDRVLRAALPLGDELVAIEDALDRVLACDLRVAGNVPPFPCSAMDGYAIKAGPAGRTLTLLGESRAGTPADQQVSEEGAIRISTGAAVPAGATAVIRQEDAAECNGTVQTLADVPERMNIRDAGEDMRSGEALLAAGTVLGPAELGAAVAAGVGELVVARQPRVAIFCTGDELRAPGEPLSRGEIHNSNAPMLSALVRRSGSHTTAAGRLRDDRTVTQDALAAALGDADLVIVSGGVSVGPHDHVKPALAALGVEEHFWGVALQPGKPTWFGLGGDKLVFGLPGNPVSAVVTFVLFARPAIRSLLGETTDERPHDRTARLTTAVRRNAAREQAVRVRLTRPDGELQATPNGPQGSHILTSLLGADALAMIPRGDGELPAGEAVALEALFE